MSRNLLPPDPPPLVVGLNQDGKWAPLECMGVGPAPVEPTESILQEAHRLTHGDRNKDYGHPLDDYTRTAAMFSALMAHKLKEPLTAAEMAMAMICVKLSRQVHHPKRDNTVDGAGYFWVTQACIDETQRRAQAGVK